VVSSPSCASMTRLTAAPNASTSTTAYYDCTLSNYSGTVSVASATGTALGSATFSLPAPTVTAAFATVTKYGAPALATVIGTNLDSSSGVTATATGCKNVTLLTQAPTVSSSTTAYYQCTVSGAYSGGLTVKDAFGKVLDSSATFTVAPPVVTLAVTNGAGVNGNIVISLAGDKAPKTVDNFLAYVNTGFYTNMIFHRVVPGFIMQAGGYQANVTNLSTATIKTPTFSNIAVEQSGLSNVTNSIAMANNGTTLGTNSQFFFNLANNTGLDGGYSVFGAITSGANVLGEILAAPSSCVANPAAGTTDCLPIPNVVISSAMQTQ
jgi:cyclophilin family peptidyl-prolyl cis-trans isomerase